MDCSEDVSLFSRFNNLKPFFKTHLNFLLSDLKKNFIMKQLVINTVFNAENDSSAILLCWLFCKIS